MLSIIDAIRGAAKDDDKKEPAVYKLYDFTKWGTDIVNQKISFYNCKTKRRE